MKHSGIVRKVDSLGRIVLPMELRKILSINHADLIEIYTSGNSIVLRKYENADIFTGDTDELVEYMGKKVSKKSILELCRIAGLTVSTANVTHPI